jgi:pimeloyl-ACP methyl ester carboxylesterase
MKQLKRILLNLLALALAGAALWFRPAFTWPINPIDAVGGGGRSIASLEPVTLGGMEQWLLIRGDDRTRPIVLFLHGDPGRPEIYMAHAWQRPLEHDFVVVQWDRRGSGKSYYDDPDRPIRFTQELADAVELIGRLQARFGPRKVIVVGHSYGSWLGVALAQQHPELVRAYVGVGQVACTHQDEEAIQDSWLKVQAGRKGDATTVARATAGGTWDRKSALMRYGGEVSGIPGPLPFAWMGLTAPEYTIEDVINIQEGWQYDHAHMIPDGPPFPLARSVPALQVPAWFFQGRQDYLAPGLCVERYAQALQAPLSRIEWFEKSAHFPFLDEPEHFHQTMLQVAASSKDRQ